ncbi:MAG: hypothetical protein F6K58_18265 [Symploca sp. SIO2E9]|nr:hypothetical protein [Symploca sp. SIO2E9]
MVDFASGCRGLLNFPIATNCLEKGIGVPQVASWVGNSPKTIWQHYAGVICVQDVPTFE